MQPSWTPSSWVIRTLKVTLVALVVYFLLNYLLVLNREKEELAAHVRRLTQEIEHKMQDLETTRTSLYNENKSCNNTVSHLSQQLLMQIEAQHKAEEMIIASRPPFEERLSRAPSDHTYPPGFELISPNGRFVFRFDESSELSVYERLTAPRKSVYLSDIATNTTTTTTTTNTNSDSTSPARAVTTQSRIYRNNS
eukprot:TRINITY_DN9304_c0_g1_i2.p1 TRINITY_DN9304_c0_g1~~TRINITY_DN9304_c0_g1_i2.p1  ORF type:complete len:204 (-),score=41.34 TRINITY_DN9304_c0_g1_i2:102-686(-)